jgi:hypothetical protein
MLQVQEVEGRVRVIDVSSKLRQEDDACFLTEAEGEQHLWQGAAVAFTNR